MRPVDADAMLAELKPVTYEMEHSSVTIADMSNIIRNWVERQPTLTPPNEPLTLDELREMDGEPVWIKSKYYGVRGDVVRIMGQQEGERYVHLETNPYLQENGYEKTWSAFRSRPQEGEEDV